MGTFKQVVTILLTLVLSCLTNNSFSQSYKADSTQEKSHFQWPEGKKMGLSLTFDDARLSQPDKGIPLLDKYGVKATFYISPNDMVKRLEGLKNAVGNGHDIGNHSLVHPCSGNFTFLSSRDEAL